MQLRRPERADCLVVRRRDVADVRDESVVRVERVETTHDAVAHDLRHDRRGGDRRAPCVAVDDGAVRRRRRPEPEAVDEAGVGGRMQVGEHGPQASEVRAVQAVAVDRPRPARSER